MSNRMEEDITKTLSVLDSKASSANSKYSASKQMNKKKEIPIVYQTNIPNLVDIVLHNGKPSYLILNNNELQIIQEVPGEKRGEAVRYFPPSLEHIHWLLVEGKQVIEKYQEWISSPKEANKRLFDALVQYHQEVSELPWNEYYILLALWVIHTYLQEKFQYSPMLCFFAVAERGKSRTSKGIAYASYRGIRVTSMREAYIFRIASRFGATIFFDLMDVWKEAGKRGCDDIILNRFERGSNVPRVNPEKDGFEDTKFYEVFGPTILATNNPLNETLGTRAITINMQNSTRRFEEDVLPEHARDLRTMLTAFRAYYLDKVLPKTDKPVMGRLGDILKPLYQIMQLVSPDHEQSFIQICQRAKSLSLYEKSNSTEGQLLRCILSLEYEVANGVLPLTRIHEEFNKGKPEQFHKAPKSIGTILTALGLRSDIDRPRTSTGAAAMTWNHERIQQLAESYGLLFSSELTVDSDFFTKITDKTDRTDANDLNESERGGDPDYDDDDF